MSIALIFWLLIKLSQTFKTSREINIEYNFLSDKMTFVDTPPSKVKAFVEGRGWDLMSNYFSTSPTKISFEMPDRSTFTIPSSLLKSKIAQELPNLEIKETGFDYIVLNMEERIEKKVPIILQSELKYAAQFQLKDSIKIKPDSVLIFGPSTQISEVNEWYTKMLQLTDLKNNTTAKIPLQNPNNQQLRLKPEEVNVDIEVEQFTEKSLFIKVDVKNAPDSLKIFPERIKLTCVLGLSRYNEIRPEDFALEVNLKNFPLNTVNNTIPILVTKQPNYINNIKLSDRAVEFFFVK